MAKFARDEAKPFSPIDSKLLGGLAEMAIPEPTQPIQTPPPEAPGQPEAPAIARKPLQQPKPTRPEVRSKPQSAPVVRPKPPENERLTRVVKCLFTATEEQELRNLVNRLREKTGMTLSFSHLMRPFFDLLLQSEGHLAEELANTGLRRPINDKNALAAFERELAFVIHEALRKTESKPAPKRA